MLLAAAPGAATAGEIPIGEPATPRHDCPASSAICHASNYAVATPQGGSVTNSVRYTARSGTYRGGSTERMFSSFGVGAHPAWTGIDGYRAYVDVSGTYAPLFTPFACIMPPGARADSDLCDGGFSSSQDSPRQFVVTVPDDARRIRVGWNFAPTRQQTIDGGQTMTAFVRWFAIDGQAPTFAFDPVAGDGGAEPTLSGQARDNVGLGTVTLSIDDVEVATAGPDGRVQHTAQGLATGEHTATVQATDAAGNSSLSARIFYVQQPGASRFTPPPPCRRRMKVVLSMNFSTNRPRDRRCWQVWRTVPPRTNRRDPCEFDGTPDVMLWGWNEIKAVRASPRRVRAGIRACQYRHRPHAGIVYFAYGAGRENKVATWNLDHEPPTSRIAYRMLELYTSDPDSLAPAFGVWHERHRSRYAGVVNVGSTRSDARVLRAVQMLCRATPGNVMGLYAGRRFRQLWEARRRRVAAVLDTCTR